MQIHELNTFSGTPGGTDYFAVDTGFDTAKISGEKLLKPLKDEINSLNNKQPYKLNTPLDGDNQPTSGTAGQMLRTNGDGSTAWVDEGLPTDAQTEAAVTEWLNNHPEATTTVQDGSLTEAKFSAALKRKAIKDYVTPEMYGAAGDGVADDTQAIKDALAASDYVMLPNKYKITDKIEIYSNTRTEPKYFEIVGELICENGFLHVYEYNSYVFGGGAITGYAPEAFIVLGGLSDNQTINALNCIIDRLYIKATQPTIGVMLRNYYLGLYGCYCNTVSNIYCEDCTVAVDLVGDANANSITNINLMSYDDANIQCMFMFEGLIYNGTVYAPLENNLSNSFYLRGIDTPTILIKTSCGNRMSRNAFSCITGEQQGSNSIFIEIEAGATPTRNIFVGIMSNTLLGYFSIPDEALLRSGENTFICEAHSFQPNINSNNGVFFGGLSVGKNQMSAEGAFTYLATEDTQFTLFDTDGHTATGISPRDEGAFVEVYIVENRRGVPLLQHCERALLYVNNASMAFVEQSTNQSRLSISGFDLKYKPGNNGTGLSDIKITCYYKVAAYNGYAGQMIENIIS